MAITSSLDALGAVTITARPSHRLMKGLTYSITFFACLYAGYRMEGAVKYGEHGAPITLAIAWFCLWLLVTVLFGSTLLWIVFGREVVFIQPTVLSLWREIAGLKFLNKKVFLRAEIKNIQIEEYQLRQKGHTFNRYALVLDYRGENTRLLSLLSSEDAMALQDALSKIQTLQ